LDTCVSSLMEQSDGMGMSRPISPDASVETESKAKNKAWKSAPVTSLMLSNLPCCVSQEELAAIINRGGFEDRYDYLYLPKPARGGRTQNISYGFINLLTPKVAKDFIQCFQGHVFEGTSSSKVMQVKPAKVQGFSKNVCNFAHAHGKDRSCRQVPLLMKPK